MAESEYAVIDDGFAKSLVEMQKQINAVMERMLTYYQRGERIYGKKSVAEFALVALFDRLPGEYSKEARHFLILAMDQYKESLERIEETNQSIVQGYEELKIITGEWLAKNKESEKE